MKKWLKIVIGIFLVIILSVILDFICILTINKPLFAIRQDNGDSVNIIYKGILYDTYNCHDYTSSHVVLKGSKFSCSQEIRIDKFVNYDFSVVVTTPTENKKIKAFEHDGIDYYYGNTDYRLYLTEGNYRYDLETSIKNGLVTLDNILNKSINVNVLYDGGSKLYQFRQFNILVCNTIDGNRDIIVGDIMEIGDFCK